MSCICKVFQKLTRAKLKVQIFGQTTVPKEREEKDTQPNHAHKLLKKIKVVVRISHLQVEYPLSISLLSATP